MADNQLNKMLGAVKLSSAFQTIYTASSTGNGKQVAGTLNITCLDANTIRYLDVIVNDGTNDYFYIEHMGLARGGTDVIPISIADGQSLKVRVTATPTQMVISGATAANPVVVTVDDTTPLQNNDIVQQAAVVGMTEINNRYRTTKLSSTTYSLQDLSGADIDGSAFTAYTSGGTADKQVGDATFWGYEEDIPQV
jgi:ubiquitin-activating enzyme E1-like protein